MERCAVTAAEQLVTDVQDNAESLVTEAEQAVVDAKDKVVGGAKYVASRFTAPAAGADGAGATADHASDKAKQAADASKVCRPWLCHETATLIAMPGRESSGVLSPIRPLPCLLFYNLADDSVF